MALTQERERAIARTELFPGSRGVSVSGTAARSTVMCRTLHPDARCLARSSVCGFVGVGVGVWVCGRRTASRTSTSACKGAEPQTARP